MKIKTLCQEGISKINQFHIHTFDKFYCALREVFSRLKSEANSLAVDRHHIWILLTFQNRVYRPLLNKWSKNVDVDIEKQIKFFNKELDSNISGPSPYQFKNKSSDK